MSRVRSFLAALRGPRSGRYVPSAHQVPSYRIIPTSRRRRPGAASPWLILLAVVFAFGAGAVAMEERLAMRAAAKKSPAADCTNARPTPETENEPQTVRTA